MHYPTVIDKYNTLVSCQLTTRYFSTTIYTPYKKMQRKKHPNKEIEQALQYAEQHGWQVEPGGNHAWGKIYCPTNDKECRCGEFCITTSTSH